MAVLGQLLPPLIMFDSTPIKLEARSNRFMWCSVRMDLVEVIQELGFVIFLRLTDITLRMPRFMRCMRCK